MFKDIYIWFEEFLNKLPPLLQLIVGIFIALGVFKILTIVFDFFKKRKKES